MQNKREIPIKDLNKIRMSVDKTLPRKVVYNGKVLEYVGIGWIDVTKQTSLVEIVDLPIVIEDSNT